jgi:hypothetical protein
MSARATCFGRIQRLAQAPTSIFYPARFALPFLTEGFHLPRRDVPHS